MPFARTHPPDPLHTSPFSNLPPPETYNPAYTVSRPRGEAGALTSGPQPNTTSLLPRIFRQRISDLSNTDDDDDHPPPNPHTPTPPPHTTHTQPPTPKQIPISTQPETLATHSNHHCNTVSQPDVTPSKSVLKLRKKLYTGLKSTPIPPQTPSTNNNPTHADIPVLASTAPTWRRFVVARPSGVFVICGKAVDVLSAHVIHVVEEQFGGEVVSCGGHVMRIRVWLGDAAHVACTAVVSFDSCAEGVRVSVRRCFADCFRVGAALFDAFSADLERLLRALDR